MPIKSPKQFRFMEASANGGLKGLGAPPKVAKEFISKTPKKKLSSFAKAFSK